MEIFGGFMAMMSMVTLFLGIVWLIMPFVVFAIKGRQERTIEMLEDMKRELAEMKAELRASRLTHALPLESGNEPDKEPEVG